jgi:predicted metalloprotease with PDZ domain
MLEPSPYAPCLEVASEDLAGFDLGFDFDASRAAKAITGLRAGSAAAQAGLQEGQKVAGWSVSFGDITKPVKLTVVDGGATREIQYVPLGPKIATPQFRPLTSGLSKDCPR